MAIIVLNGADFSQNNLGKIDIFTGFHDTTLGVFSKFGITEDSTNPMQVATDKFIRNLITAGIWGNGKIDNLCLPYLAILADENNPSVTNAIQNCVGAGNFFAPYSGQDINLELNNNGIRPLRNDGWCATLSQEGSYSNNHYSAFIINDADNVAEYNSNSTKMSKVIYGAGFGNLIALFSGQTGSDRTIWVSSSPSNSCFGSVNKTLKSRFLIGSYKSLENEGKTVLYEDGTKILSNAVSKGSGNVKAFFGIYSSDYKYKADPTQTTDSYAPLKAPCGILSSGGYLTETEATAFNTAAQNLVTAIHTFMD